jgi:DNA-binding MarR family transcriptional regulator
VQAIDEASDPRSIVLAAVRDPGNAGTIGALTDFLSVMQRWRLLRQQGAPAMALLVHLARSNPMRSSDLASAMHLDQSTVSRHLAHLESAGLVTRTPDPADRRAHHVAATTEGREQARQVISSRVQDFEVVVDAWSDRDRSDLARLLTRFSAEFSGQIEEGLPFDQQPTNPTGATNPTKTANPTPTTEDSR